MSLLIQKLAAKNWVAVDLEIGSQNCAAADIEIGSKNHADLGISIRCRNCVIYSESTFVAEIVLFLANHFSLPNRVVCSESVFAAKLWCLQRISVHSQVVSATNHFTLPNRVVRRELVFAGANQCSLPKLCCMQRMSVLCQNCVVRTKLVFTTKSCCPHRISFHCWYRVACSQLVFAVEIILSVANQHSLPKLCFLHRIRFHCWIVLSAAN